MNHRRTLLVALGAGALVNPLAAIAQQAPATPRRIGFLTLSNAQTTAAWLAAFRAGMLALRWTEGRDYVIDARYGNGDSQAGPARLVAQLTKTIPVVFTLAQDPIASGLAASLRQPGGNVTGLTNIGSAPISSRHSSMPPRSVRKPMP